MVSVTWKRIFISVDMEYKNRTTLNSEEISLRRDVDNLDKKYTRPINGIVIDAENIPKGAEVIIHHNAVHDTYRIFDYNDLSGESISSNIRYFSIPETECYAWRLGDGEWNPCKGFELGLRIFKPYTGALDGLLPTQIKNKLYVTSGEYKGKVVMTKMACDYEMIYQDKNGKEGRLIRFRHFNEPENIREEVVGVDHEETTLVSRGKLLIGLSPTNCKTLN